MFLVVRCICFGWENKYAVRDHEVDMMEKHYQVYQYLLITKIKKWYRIIPFMGPSKDKEGKVATCLKM